MKIYFNEQYQELLDEEEARQRAEEIVDNNLFYLDELRELSYVTIWDMLTEEAKQKIMNNAIDNVLNEEFVYRDF